MSQQMLKQTKLWRRTKRIRRSLLGTSERPRLAVARTLRNIEAQIVDDLTGKTLVSVSTRSKDIQAQAPYGGNQSAAKLVGKLIGEKAQAAGITKVCFDRRGRRYHGRVKAVADAAREAGLQF